MNLLEAMRYLVALEQHRHFGRAASACHITQPALSNALRSLEAELEVAIVRRGRSYEGLTPEGERVLASANLLLREQELLRQDLHSSVGTPRGTLVIGSIPTAIPVAARFAAQLQARHGGIVPVVRSLSSPEIETGLENLALDMGLGYTERNKKFKVLPQYVEQYFLLRRRSAGAAALLQLGEVVSWREAAAMPQCLLTHEMHNRTIIDAAFRKAGFDRHDRAQRARRRGVRRAAGRPDGAGSRLQGTGGVAAARAGSANADRLHDGQGNAGIANARGRAHAGDRRCLAAPCGCAGRDSGRLTQTLALAAWRVCKSTIRVSNGSVSRINWTRAYALSDSHPRRPFSEVPARRLRRGQGFSLRTRVLS
jgi:DNA-binding transcriptional LysR family regulator